MKAQEMARKFSRRRNKANKIGLIGLMCAAAGALITFLWMNIGMGIVIVGLVIFGVGMAYLPGIHEEIILTMMLRHEYNLEFLERQAQIEYENMKRLGEISLKSLWKEGREQ